MEQSDLEKLISQYPFTHKQVNELYDGLKEYGIEADRLLKRTEDVLALALAHGMEVFDVFQRLTGDRLPSDPSFGR